MGLDWAGGIGALAGAVAESGRDSEKKRVELDYQRELMAAQEAKEQRLYEWKKRLDVGMEEEAYQTKRRRADDERTKQAGDIEGRAGILASKRQELDPSKAGAFDATAIELQEQARTGKITKEQRDAAQSALSQSADANRVPGKVSQDDRTQAAIELGYIGPKDAATLSDKDAERALRQEIAQVRTDAAFQKMDAELRVKAAQLESKLATGEKLTAQERNIAHLVSSGGKTMAEAIELVYRPDGRVSEYDTVETEKDNPDGSKTKTVSKRKRDPNASQSDTPSLTWTDTKTGKSYKEGDMIPGKGRLQFKDGKPGVVK